MTVAGAVMTLGLTQAGYSPFAAGLFSSIAQMIFRAFLSTADAVNPYSRDATEALKRFKYLYRKNSAYLFSASYTPFCIRTSTTEDSDLLENWDTKGEGERALAWGWNADVGMPAGMADRLPLMVAYALQWRPKMDRPDVFLNPDDKRLIAGQDFMMRTGKIWKNLPLCETDEGVGNPGKTALANLRRELANAETPLRRSTELKLRLRIWWKGFSESSVLSNAVGVGMLAIAFGMAVDGICILVHQKRRFFREYIRHINLDHKIEQRRANNALVPHPYLTDDVMNRCGVLFCMFHYMLRVFPDYFFEGGLDSPLAYSRRVYVAWLNENYRDNPDFFDQARLERLLHSSPYKTGKALSRFVEEFIAKVSNPFEAALPFRRDLIVNYQQLGWPEAQLGPLKFRDGASTWKLLPRHCRRYPQPGDVGADDPDDGDDGDDGTNYRPRAFALPYPPAPFQPDPPGNPDGDGDQQAVQPDGPDDQMAVQADPPDGVEAQQAVQPDGTEDQMADQANPPGGVEAQQAEQRAEEAGPSGAQRSGRGSPVYAERPIDDGMEIAEVDLPAASFSLVDTVIAAHLAKIALSRKGCD